MTRWNLCMRIANQRTRPDMSYKILWIPLVIVIGALVLFKWKGCTPVWRAVAPAHLLYSRSLPLNHQITADDINFGQQDTNRVSVHDSLGSFLGRHLIQARKAGEVMRGGDLSRVPPVPVPGKDSSIFLLALSSAEQPLLQLLDGGEYIQVADTSHLFRPGCLLLRVVAVHRATTEVPGNWLLVEGPTAKAVENQFRISASTRMILLHNKPDSTMLAGCKIEVKVCRVKIPLKHPCRLVKQKKVISPPSIAAGCVNLFGI